MNEVYNNGKSKTKSKNESESGYGGYGGYGYGMHGGGRFLTWNMEKQWWLVIHSDDDEIQKKIHYAFRDFRKKMLKTQQPQQKVQPIHNTNSNSNSIFKFNFCTTTTRWYYTTTTKEKISL